MSQNESRENSDVFPVGNQNFVLVSLSQLPFEIAMYAWLVARELDALHSHVSNEQTGRPEGRHEPVVYQSMISYPKIVPAKSLRMPKKYF